MPFADDHNCFRFRSFQNKDSTEKQDNAADELVKSMLVDDSDLCR